MATAWSSEGPLDDYLQEFEEIGDKLMRERSVTSTSRLPGQWMGERDAIEPDWDHLLFEGSYATYLTPPPLFPEKLKYLVCSSGLLDPGLVGVGEIDKVLGESWVQSLRCKVEGWAQEGKRRPDLTCAVVILVVAVCYCAGVMFTLLLLIVALGTALWRAEPRDVPNPQALVLESLKGLIAEADALDREIALALEAVAKHKLALTEPLRLHLLRLSQSLTEHFATAYSTLLPLSSSTELALFLEMYGLPETPRKRRDPPSPLHCRVQSQLDDRFTSIPPRTPRQSKRASWNAGHMDTPARKSLSPGLFTPPSSFSGLSPPGLLPSALDRTLGKRSSLQSLPYYPPDSDGSEIALERSRSVGKAWRPSKAHQLSPLRPPRAGALLDAPLTHPSLKAAFFAAHLKRQRMACCLLALRFKGEADVENARYWLQVRAVLESLRVGCRDERHGLDYTVEEPIQETTRLSQHSHLPPQLADFAPRTPDRQMMLQRLESLEQTMHTATLSLRAISLDDYSYWRLRDDIGAIVREWERGREVMERIQGAPPLPPFMKAWSESPPPTTPPLPPLVPSPLSSPAQSDDDVGEHLLSSASPASLPLPGADVVFEGYAARGGQRAKPQPALPMLSGGMVVDELRDVIDLIKRRKGHDEDQMSEKKREDGRDERGSWSRHPVSEEHPFSFMALPPPPRRSDQEAGLITE